MITHMVLGPKTKANSVILQSSSEDETKEDPTILEHPLRIQRALE